MSDTSHHLEREIEAHRAGVEETLGKLKDRMSVEQIVDDVGQFLGMEDVRGALRTAGQQVRQNPIALGIVGVGLAWLLLGRAISSPSPDDGWDRDGSASDRPYTGGWAPESGQRGTAGSSENYGDGGLRTEANGLADQAKSIVSDVAGTLGDAPGKVRDMVGRASDRVQSAVGSARDTASDAVRPIAGAMGGQPLLMGAAALAAGAVIGSALPRTRTEDRILGPQRDRLVDEAATMTREMGDRAFEAARATYDAASRTARDAGLIPEGETLAEKVQRVATTAIDTAKSQIDPVLHGTDAEPRRAGRRK